VDSLPLGRVSPKFSTGSGTRNPAVTLKVYSHWFRDADTGAIDRFTRGFLGNLKKVGTKIGRTADQTQ
jgi:hypothetical protein